jgi:hypothetical protein
MSTLEYVINTYLNQIYSRVYVVVNGIFEAVFCTLLFSLAVNFYGSRRTCRCTENRTHAASPCSSYVRSSHLPQLFARSFSQHSQYFLSEYLDVPWLWITLFKYFFFSCICWPCTAQIVSLFTLSIFVCSLILFPLWFFRLSSTLITSSLGGGGGTDSLRFKVYSILSVLDRSSEVEVWRQ